MGSRWGGHERRVNLTTRARIDKQENQLVVRALLVGGAIGLVSGIVTGYVLDNPPAAQVSRPRVELSTDALLDAATIEMRGYGPDGRPGTFLYDCAYEGEEKRLVCEQQGDGDG